MQRQGHFQSPALTHVLDKLNPGTESLHSRVNAEKTIPLTLRGADPVTNISVSAGLALRKKVTEHQDILMHVLNQRITLGKQLP